MADQGMIETILGQVGASAVAALALWILYLWHKDSEMKNANDKIDRQQRHDREIATYKALNENEAKRTDMLVNVVKGNTESNVKLIETVNSLREEIRGMKAVRSE